MFQNLFRMLAEMNAEQVARDPVGFLMQNLMLDVVEDVELKRFARLVGRLDTIDHAAPDTVDEVPVEECDRLIELAVQLDFPFLPLLMIEIIDRHPPAGPFEEMLIIEPGLGGVPELFGTGQMIARPVP